MVLEKLKNKIKDMTDAELIKMLSDGKDTYQQGVYELYVNEAKKREIELTNDTFEEVINDQSKREKWNIIRLGYSLALLGGFLGIVTAIYILTKKIKTEKNELVYKFEKEIRKHGTYIIALNCGMTIFWLTFFKKIIYFIF